MPSSPGRKNSPTKRPSPTWILVAILAVGTMLIMPRLGTQSLWHDEGLTVAPVLNAHSLGDLVERVRGSDTQPPGSHFFVYLMRQISPPTEFSFRLPSFLAIEGGLALLFLLLRRRWGPSIALIAVALAQLSPFLAFFAAEARNYGVWFLAVVASLLVMDRWCESAVREPAASADGHRRTGRAGPWAWACAWGVVNGLGLWFHLFHVFLIAGELALVVALAVARPRLLRRPAPILGSAVLAQIVTALVFAPWLADVAVKMSAGPSGVGWTRPFSWLNVPYYLYALNFGFSLGPALRELHTESMRELLGKHAVAFGVAGLVLAASGAAYLLLVRDALRRRERRWELLAFCVLPLAGLIGPFVYGVVTSFPLHPRHLLFVWPLLPLISALGLARLRPLRIPLIVLVIVQIVALANLLYNPYYWKDDARGATNFAETHSRGTAYVLGDLAFFYTRTTQAEHKWSTDFVSDTRDIWLVDDRRWVPANQQALNRLRERMKTLGFEEQTPNEQFRGIILRHWVPREP